VRGHFYSAKIAPDDLENQRLVGGIMLKKRRRFISFIPIWLFAVIDAQAAPLGTKDVTATLFQWSFASVAKECTETLGPKGYAWVEVSPAHEHIPGLEWWTSYQPIDYKIGNRLGDRQAFKKMIDTCHQAGVKVMADAVINHMSSGNRYNEAGFGKYNYPGLYKNHDFHTCRRDIGDNYHDRKNVQFCELVGLSDLKTEDDQVQSKIAGYLNELISLGVDGFRIDAAKHIPAADLVAIKAKLSNQAIYWVSEVIYGDGEAIHPQEYTHLGDVDEFRFGRDLKRIFLKEKLSYLNNFGEAWGYLSSFKARSFVDNWDTERNGSTLTYKNNADYTLANIFMLAWPYGAPNVYSGYEFSDHNAGPPHGGYVHACFQDGWKCQHKWPQIIKMVAFRNAASGNKVTDWWSNGNNAIAFGRGNKAFVVINHEHYPISYRWKTSLPKGSYCDVQHGEITETGCQGVSYAVDKNGHFTATVGPNDAIAFYVTRSDSIDGQ
jgi:alpha-amylase